MCCKLLAFLLYQDPKGPAKSLKKQKNPLLPGFYHLGNGLIVLTYRAKDPIIDIK